MHMTKSVRYAHWSLLAGAFLAVSLVSGTTACLELGGAVDPLDDLAQVEEAWVSEPMSAQGSLDSPAFWGGGGTAGWIIASSKLENALVVLDAATGRFLHRIGGASSDRFHRPNGVAVWGRRLFVVERDIQRVTVLSLPGLETLGSFGEEILTYPYGITISPRGDGVADVLVTDGSPLDGTEGGQPRAVDESIQHFRLRIRGGELSSSLIQGFGAGQAPLSKVESIAYDRGNQRVLVADEEAKHVRVFSMDGTSSGGAIGEGYVRVEPEGIVVVDCGTRSYVVLTDQDDVATRFHLLDATTLQRLGGFRGRVTANTDGIAFTNRTVGSMKGAFFAVHADQAVSAFSWASILKAQGLPACDLPG